ncbi:6-phosphogluconolactonase [Porticoccaceae bacterium]|jgi:6-phosphogluconolactonase|nr:6-phosphogluconolactonase [Porticoccaceae bacterium]MCT2531742.1 6-phosphogluconolactonase [SAR92 clade bacterium H231]MBT7258390.1 6-phosphogluconolactonase [Porticoccaceae bacterium]MBT7904926.1 6-phosphogluconolactonase [Porticoccaceae bacterium]MDA8920051.1 6-phosphogluconolactonase [Porticoccaceae bacterium]
MNMVEFENTSALDIELAEKVAALLAADIQARGKASLVVSGGRTPMGFFHLLSQQLLDWSSVTVTLADERWVDADHQDSNEKLVRENLLINEAHQAQFISLKSAAENAVDAESECEQALASAGQFTVVILGMGDDGHTASLFPGTEALALGLDMNSGRTAIAVTPTAAPHQRMSMTLPRLLNAGQVIIHISGSSKQDVLLAAQNGDNAAELPIRAILGQQVAPLSVYWAK